MVICLERGADLHMAQLMPLPLTIFCVSKTQIGFTFLVPDHPNSPGQRAVKRARVCVCVVACKMFQLVAHQLAAAAAAVARVFIIFHGDVRDDADAKSVIRRLTRSQIDN